MVVTAEILPKETDSSYDNAKIHLKREPENYLSGWEVERIILNDQEEGYAQ